MENRGREKIGPQTRLCSDSDCVADTNVCSERIKGCWGLRLKADFGETVIGSLFQDAYHTRLIWGLSRSMANIIIPMRIQAGSQHVVFCMWKMYLGIFEGRIFRGPKAIA